MRNHFLDRAKFRTGAILTVNINKITPRNSATIDQLRERSHLIEYESEPTEGKARFFASLNQTAIAAQAPPWGPVLVTLTGGRSKLFLG